MCNSWKEFWRESEREIREESQIKLTTVKGKLRVGENLASKNWTSFMNCSAPSSPLSLSLFLSPSLSLSLFISIFVYLYVYLRFDLWQLQKMSPRWFLFLASTRASPVRCMISLMPYILPTIYKYIQPSGEEKDEMKQKQNKTKKKKRKKKEKKGKKR